MVAGGMVVAGASWAARIPSQVVAHEQGGGTKVAEGADPPFVAMAFARSGGPNRELIEYSVLKGTGGTFVEIDEEAEWWEVVDSTERAASGWVRVSGLRIFGVSADTAVAVVVGIVNERTTGIRSETQAGSRTVLPNVETGHFIALAELGPGTTSWRLTPNDPRRFRSHARVRVHAGRSRLPRKHPLADGGAVEQRAGAA